MARRKVSGMSTMDVVLIGGVGLLAVYLLTKKSTPTVVTVPTGTSSTTNTGSSNSTSALLESGSDLIDSLSNLF